MISRSRANRASRRCRNSDDSAIGIAEVRTCTPCRTVESYRRQAEQCVMWRAKRRNSRADVINPSRKSVCRSKNSLHRMTGNVPSRPRKCSAAGSSNGRLMLNEYGADELGETVTCPIQSTLYRPQIAPGDFGDLLVALALELPEDEHLPVVFRQPLDTLVHRILQEALAVQIVRTCGRILELQRPMIGFPVLLDRLKKHQRVAAAVTQLILRQVRGDRVDPGGEFLRLVEPVQVAEDPDEHFLHEVFGPLAVANRAIDEVQQTGLIPVDEGAEGLRLTSEVPHDDLPII